MNNNHLKEFGVGYWLHLKIALTLSIVLLIHGIFPMFFDKYVKDWFVKIYNFYPKDKDGNVL